MVDLKDKPALLIGCTPGTGHLMPIRAVARELVQRGFDVTFITSSAKSKIVEETGATVIPLRGWADYTESDTDLEITEEQKAAGNTIHWSQRKVQEPGLPQMQWDLENIFIKSMPSQYEAIQRGLAAIKTRHPDKRIVLVSEGWFFGSAASILEAPGLRPDAWLTIGIIAFHLSSIDTAPFGPGLPPDSSEEGRQRNVAMTKAFQQGAMGGIQALWQETLAQMEAKKTSVFMMDSPMLLPDRFIQMCSPSIEYPRSDLPSNIRFAGGLPKGGRGLTWEAPSWWDDVVINADNKHVVVVCQGTVVIDYEKLVLPTIEAFQEREDILVVAVLGRKDMSLPAGTSVPRNVRVADYIPYDELFPHCAAAVMLVGYGSLQHAVANGTPLVVAGDTEDKPENAARVEWAGIGISLKTGSPTPNAIREAVDEVILKPQYKTKVQALQAEMTSYDPISVIAENLLELATKPR